MSSWLNLNQQGVTTLLVPARHGPAGQMSATVDLTYLSDTIVLFRFVEASGHLRRAVRVVKKRAGPHQDTIRELGIDGGGLRVGEPLTASRGVLTGVPTFEGKPGQPLARQDAADRNTDERE
ncbi:Circadian clock protein kinase KaiC [Methylobacterium crusticola]|uniref:Circadian clock protein kinase KaiC n=1 Tax=Methylobacterium crusticola TaxID=1697972 RepID=A0ABQ4QSZ2_9HYPH|nr:Circadian clock protein kinase KaiC [Methylobacterium crusticola]